MSTMVLGGPMFESARTDLWESIHGKSGAHYNIFSLNDGRRGMEALRQLFPTGEADELNLCLFSTSGVHGSYSKIEDVEKTLRENLPQDHDDFCDELTVLVIQPRIVCLRYGNISGVTLEDVAWLKRLRESSAEQFSKIGRKEPANGQ